MIAMKTPSTKPQGLICMYTNLSKFSSTLGWRMGLGQNELPPIFLMASSCLSTTFSSTSSSWISYLATTMKFSIFRHSISIFANAASPIRAHFHTPFNVTDLLYSIILYKVVHWSRVAYNFDWFSLRMSFAWSRLSSPNVAWSSNCKVWIYICKIDNNFRKKSWNKQTWCSLNFKL
jgi:hypothetical protein